MTTLDTNPSTHVSLCQLPHSLVVQLIAVLQ
jgi:hypothetical protein